MQAYDTVSRKVGGLYKTYALIIICLSELFTSSFNIVFNTYIIDLVEICLD